MRKWQQTLQICTHINHVCTSSDSLLWTFDISTNRCEFSFLKRQSISHKSFWCKTQTAQSKASTQNHQHQASCLVHQAVTVSADRPRTNQSLHLHDDSATIELHHPSLKTAARRLASIIHTYKSANLCLYFWKWVLVKAGQIPGSRDVAECQRVVSARAPARFDLLSRHLRDYARGRWRVLLIRMQGCEVKSVTWTADLFI